MEQPQRDDGVLSEEAAPVSPDQFIQFVTQTPNLATELDAEELTRIGKQVLEDFDMDKASMTDWFTRMERGLNLAKLVKENRVYPYDGASNIKYPLITSAALQFNARAYPAIVPSDQVVKAITYGTDKDGMKAARADRIAAHMSWQLTTKLEEWEEETDRLLLQLPIVGTMVRKWWIDPIARRARCRLIEPGKFIVNDKVKNLADAPRCSEELPLYPAEIESRIRSGQFIDFEYDKGEDKQGPQDFIEQHTRIDLDDDGYPEPYIVTVHKDKMKIVRMVADFGPEDVAFKTEQVMQQGVDPYGMPALMPQQVNTGIVQINRGSYFVAHQFWPSLDGGFHGTGLGLLLGDISDTINTIFNMLIDAGHYASLGGGFIGAEFRIKGGAMRMKPGEWKLVGTSGQNIQQSIVPMTFPGPDATLFQMLGMLIEAGREISSTKDIMTGDDGGRTQTATTTMALIEQGMMVFTAAYKRIFRALKQEYRLLAKINAQTVSPEEYNMFHDLVDQQGQPVQLDPAKEYSTADMDVAPVADPRSVTKMQQAAKAQVVMELAEKGMVDPGQATKRILEAMSIPDVEELAPQQDPMMDMMKQMQVAAAHAELITSAANIELTMAKVESERAGALLDTANADAVGKGQRLAAIMGYLEHERATLERQLAGMAGTPGNGGAAQGAGAAASG